MLTTTTIHQHRLTNGLQLLAEPVPGAKSLAMTMLLPAGCSLEPSAQQGVAGILSDQMFRGAAGLSPREHCDALDQLGVQRGASVETHHLRLGASMIGTHLGDALPLLADTVLKPNLTDETFEPSRDLAVQGIDALQDEPQQRVMLLLRKHHQPDPLGRSPYGQRSHLEALTASDVRAFHQSRFVANGSILSFAGSFDWDDLRQRVEDIFGFWQSKEQSPTNLTEPTRGYHHEKAETSQVHVAVGYNTVSENDPQSWLQRAAVAVLSGGMSGRLFTEVREKRGLCYSVYASYAGQKDRGSVVSYAGTTAERAQETLDVLLAELTRLSEGVSQSEFDRAIVGMKSRLVMQGESTASRAAAIANDQHIVGRPRPLDELAQHVDAITLDDLNAFVAAHKPQALTTVTIGPQPLELPAP